MFETEKVKLKIALYKLKEKKVKNRNNDPIVLETIITDGFEEFKNCLLVNNRSNMEMVVKNRTIIRGSLQDRTIISFYNIFATMLGSVDVRIENWTEIEDEEYKKELLTLREKVTRDYVQVANFIENEGIVRKPLQTISTYKNFDKMPFDSQNQLNGFAISAYMNGYNHGTYGDYDKVIKRYKYLFSKLQETIKKIQEDQDYIKNFR